MNYQSVVFERSFGLAEQLTESDRPEIVFSGRSNVGKSSLINALFRQKKLARVSSVPGKTATINFFRCENLRFVDLPGYGFAKVSMEEKKRWADLMESYFSSERDICLVFQLIDCRHRPSDEDVQMIQFLIEAEIPFVVVLTKTDKLNKSERADRLQHIREELPYGNELTLVPFSSVNGEGINELHEIIDEINSSNDGE